MKVKGNWRLNPTGQLTRIRRIGVRLDGNSLASLGYKPLKRHADGLMCSEVLGLDVRANGRPGMAQFPLFRDPASREDLVTLQESEGRRIEGKRDHPRRNTRWRRRSRPD